MTSSAFQVTTPSEYHKAKRTIARFPPDLDKDDIEGIRAYYRNQAIKSLHAGVSWSGGSENVVDLGWGAKTTFSHGGESYTSIYVYKSTRNKGHMSDYIRLHPSERFCTTPHCELETYFMKKGVEHVVLQECPHLEYQMVQQYYGETCTDRTGIHMMNHIDEGIFILDQIGASELAIRAYIIHPLLQSDGDMLAFFGGDGPEVIPPRVLLLATEYRNIANAHLSYHKSGSDSFLLSPLKDVNDMLIADKIQNRKDFELYHSDTHPRAARLEQYFTEWLEKLGVSEERYLKMKQEILDRTGGLALAMACARPTDPGTHVIPVGRGSGLRQMPDHLKLSEEECSS